MSETETVTTPTSVSLAIDQLRKSYDAEVKNFLKEKQVLAIILKSCVKEFKGCTLEDIANKYIEGVPQVSTVAVDQDAEIPVMQQSPGSKISGAPNEDKSKNEGLVTYDIRFTAVAPESGKLIKLIINVEAQRKTKGQSYPIVKRGHYYCGRLLSAQKDVEFKGTHYEDIKKVYSIWICQNVPKNRENTIIIYRTIAEVAASLDAVDPDMPEDYDNLTVVVIGLGDTAAEKADDAVRMLATALSSKTDVNTKKQVLSEEFGIGMTETIERTVDSMCNLSYGIEERAAERSKLETLYELVHDGDISLSRGASKADQTETEFKAGMDAYYAQLASA